MKPQDMTEAPLEWGFSKSFKIIINKKSYKMLF